MGQLHHQARILRRSDPAQEDLDQGGHRRGEAHGDGDEESGPYRLRYPPHDRADDDSLADGDPGSEESGRPVHDGRGGLARASKKTVYFGASSPTVSSAWSETKRTSKKMIVAGGAFDDKVFAKLPFDEF